MRLPGKESLLMKHPITINEILDVSISFLNDHRYVMTGNESLCAKIFSGLDLNQEGEALTDSSECRPWGSHGLSSPLSLC